MTNLLDAQEESLLVAELEEANVLEVLDGYLQDVLHRPVPL